jgi:hypothetical protein
MGFERGHLAQSLDSAPVLHEVESNHPLFGGRTIRTRGDSHRLAYVCAQGVLDMPDMIEVYNGKEWIPASPVIHYDLHHTSPVQPVISFLVDTKGNVHEVEHTEQLGREIRRYNLSVQVIDRRVPWA